MLVTPDELPHRDDLAIGCDVNGAPMVVFTYRPVGCSDPSLLLVFHGIARNARTYRDDARALADRLCLLVVAPLFDRQAFPGWRYQRGGIVKGAAVQDGRDFTGRLVLDLVEMFGPMKAALHADWRAEVDNLLKQLRTCVIERGISCPRSLNCLLRGHAWW